MEPFLTQSCIRVEGGSQKWRCAAAGDFCRILSYVVSISSAANDCRVSNVTNVDNHFDIFPPTHCDVTLYAVTGV